MLKFYKKCSKNILKEGIKTSSSGTDGLIYKEKTPMIIKRFEALSDEMFSRGRKTQWEKEQSDKNTSDIEVIKRMLQRMTNQEDEDGIVRFANYLSKAIDQAGPLSGKSIHEVRKIITNSLIELNKRLLTER